MTSGTVEVGTGTAGTRFLNTNWPIEEGLELGTTKLHDREFLLKPELSNVSEREQVGL